MTLHKLLLLVTSNFQQSLFNDLQVRTLEPLHLQVVEFRFSLAFHSYAYWFIKNLWTQGEHLSIQLLQATAGLLVTCFSLIYLVDEYLLLFLMLLNEMRTQGKSKGSAVNQGNEGDKSKIFLLPPEFSTFAVSGKSNVSRFPRLYRLRIL